MNNDKFSAFTIMSNWDMSEIPELVHEHKRLLTTLLLQRKFPQIWRIIIIKKDFCFVYNNLIGYISYSVKFQKGLSVIKVGAHFHENTIKFNAEIPEKTL